MRRKKRDASASDSWRVRYRKEWDAVTAWCVGGMPRTDDIRDDALYEMHCVHHDHMNAALIACPAEQRTYLLWIVKPYLANSHAAVFFQIGPGSVDDCDIVALISCYMHVASQLSASHCLNTSNGHKCASFKHALR